MFFRNDLSAAKAAAVAREGEKALQQLREQLNEAQACPDPAEKLLQLDRMQALLGSITARRTYLESKVFKAASDRYATYSAGASFVGLILGVASIHFLAIAA